MTWLMRQSLLNYNELSSQNTSRKCLQSPSSSKMFTRPLTDVPIQGIKEFALSKDTVPYQDPILGMHFNILARLKTKKFDSISESKAPSDSEYVIYRSQDEDEEKPGLFHVQKRI